MRRLLAALLLVAAAWPAPAGAQTRRDRHIEVVQVEGNIDPVVADLILSSLRRAARTGATVVILQIDSPGALDTDPRRLEAAVGRSPVPVAAWVGPAGSSARGAATGIVLAAHVSAVSSGSRLGPLLPRRLDKTDEREAIPDKARRIARSRLRDQAAVDGGHVDLLAPTLGDLIVALDGRTVRTESGEVKLSTARVLKTDKGPRRTVNQPVRFVKLDTFASVQHSLMSPAVAYLLLVAGLALMVFEFFTLGVGLAGVAGAGALVGAFFGFSHLPVSWWALALIALSTFGFAVDVQATHLGFWTGVGVIGLLVGSLYLYDGSSLLDVPLWLVALLWVGQTVFMLGAMTVAIRNRGAVPTVGRDSMIGELGEARTDLDPDGVVLVRGAPWRARTRRGRRVAAGLPVKVVAVDQLVLEVESEMPNPRKDD